MHGRESRVCPRQQHPLVYNLGNISHTRYIFPGPLVRLSEQYPTRSTGHELLEMNNRTGLADPVHEHKIRNRGVREAKELHLRHSASFTSSA